MNVYYAMLLASGEELTLNLGPAETADASVVFVVGDERFSIADAVLHSGGYVYHYAWTVTDMEWAVGDTIEIALGDTAPAGTDQQSTEETK